MNAILRTLVTSPAVALMVATLAVSGCHSTSATKQGDPILGEIHPQNKGFAPNPPPASASTPSGNAPSGNTHGAAAPTPTGSAITGAATSPAYLASMNKSLNDGQPLAIADRPFARSPLPTVIPVPRDGGSATLTGNGGNPPPGWNQSTSVPILQAGTMTSGFVDPNEALLRSRGIVSQKQEAVPGGGIRLTAIAPNPANPGAFRTFEVQARDYPAAVQAILFQIDGKK